MKKLLSFRGCDISYSIKGSGAPVLLLHGFGEDSSVWDYIIGDLSGFKLIIPDLPGSGYSAFNENLKTIADFAECVQAILQFEAIEKVNIVGHSMGGYIALAFATMFPNSLLSLGLFHSSAFADDEQKIEMRNKAIQFIKENGSFAFLKTSTPDLFKDRNLHADQIAASLEKAHLFKKEVLIQYYQAMIARPDHTELLRNINVSVLLIIGEADKAIPFETSLAQAHLPGVSSVHILRESAHMGMIEEARKSGKILVKFLTTCITN